MKIIEEVVHLTSIRNASRVIKRVLPLTSFIMNLPRPTQEKPSLMSFTEVREMFGKV